jgi:hypothetical protein
VTARRKGRGKAPATVTFTVPLEMLGKLTLTDVVDLAFKCGYRPQLKYERAARTRTRKGKVK